MQSTGPLRICLRGDPAIDHRASQTDRYFATLDPDLIVAKHGERPIWFDARRLRRSEMLRILETAISPAHRSLLAYEAGLLRGNAADGDDHQREIGALIFRESRIDDRRAGMLAAAALISAREGLTMPCGVEPERASKDIEAARAAWDGAKSATHRETMRRAWGCDCEGYRPPLSPEHLVRDKVTTERADLEAIVGTRIHACPWRGFFDPVVRDVMDAMSWWETGQLALWLGDDPPNHLVEGVVIFRRALTATREHDRAEAKRSEGQK